MPKLTRSPSAPPSKRNLRRRKTFVLSMVGSSIADEHRITGALLERHWAHLSPEALRAIRVIVESAVKALTTG